MTKKQKLELTWIGKENRPRWRHAILRPEVDRPSFLDGACVRLAKPYLDKFGNEVDALAELDAMAHSLQSAPAIVVLQRRCQEVGRRRWTLLLARAVAVTERFPGYGAGVLLRDRCERELRQFRKTTGVPAAPPA